MISFLTLNIGAAARKRAEELLAWFSARSEDVLLLTETSPGDGTAFLLERFRKSGFHVVATDSSDGDRGAALISKIPVVRDLTLELGGVSIPARVAGAVLDTSPAIAVVSIYVPSRDLTPEKLEKKERFISSLLNSLEAFTHEPLSRTVLGGDYNVISRTHRPQYPGYRPFEFDFLERLEVLGLYDAQTHLAPDAQEYSWVGRTGDGYKYDYFHVGRSLRDRVTRCEYIADTRAQALTDHSAVVLEVAGVEGKRLEVDELRASDAMTLFDF